MVKPLVHRYRFPRIIRNGREVDSWSIWLVDNETGTLCIFGDYGNWTYTWGNPAGRDFRYPLLRFGGGYMGAKFSYGAKDELDVSAALRSIRDSILQMRRDEYLDKEKAGELWGALEYVDDQHEVQEYLRQHDNYDWWELMNYRPVEHGWLEHLMTVTLPRFKAVVRQQLFQEASLQHFTRKAAA